MLINKKPIVVCILDGWGVGDPNDKGNAIALAKTPFYDSMIKEFPNITIEASGEYVGLPVGQIGNSEVGHLNIGAGRIVLQGLSLINDAVKNNELDSNKSIQNAVNHAKKNNSNLHLMGLLSDGGVHSHIKHLEGIIDAIKNQNINNIYIHAFLDGRDVEPDSAKRYIEQILDFTKDYKNIHLASVGGRYYGMDRDKRWDRIEKSYNSIFYGSENTYKDVLKYIDLEYSEGRLDEFVIPAINSDINGVVQDNDSIIHFNFRPDRAIQLSSGITNNDYLWIPKNKRDNLSFVCMMKYADTVIGELVFPPVIVSSPLGEILSNRNYTQLRLAETEKIAHVTFFFDGGVDKIYKNSKRDLIPSPKVATYDLKPEMSAYEITDHLIQHIRNKEYDFIIMNYANADMVGHTGELKPTIQAIEDLDKCFSQFVPVLIEEGGTLFLTADHGNAEIMLTKEGKKVTKHSVNKVPLIISDKNVKFKCGSGKLGDVAPTVLHYIKEPIPEIMIGKNLIK